MILSAKFLYFGGVLNFKCTYVLIFWVNYVFWGILSREIGAGVNPRVVTSVKA